MSKSTRSISRGIFASSKAPSKASSKAPAGSFYPDLPDTIKEEDEEAEKDDFFDDSPPVYPSEPPSSSKSMKSSSRTFQPSSSGSTIKATNLHRDATIAASSSRPTIMPTNLNRDNTVGPSSSSKPKTIAQSSSRAPTMKTTLARDRTVTPSSPSTFQSARPSNREFSSKSVAPSSSRASIAPRTVVYSAKSVMPTQLYRDEKSLRASIPLDPADFSGRSMLKSANDFKMASRQTLISQMPPEQQKTQHKWALKTIEDFGPCPENNDWHEVPTGEGYMCKEGGHGMTHEMIAEGMGAICSMPRYHRHEWHLREGPYYEAKDQPADGDKSFNFNPDIIFPGVATPEKYKKYVKR